MTERIPVGITRLEREAMLERQRAVREFDEVAQPLIEETAHRLGVSSVEAITQISREVQDQLQRGLPVDPVAYTHRRLTTPN
ncbi:MAG TPA: hypothetical protein VHD84_02340 [Candidatus Saccharimonadales bacterium]|nr:hypothetical protein [Candidatus Saccharimonadales bacterium]